MKKELDWKRAEMHLKNTEEAYRGLVGIPNVNPFFAMGIVASARQRFDQGERTNALFDEIMSLK